MKKKKIYCKLCGWRNDEHSCRVFERKDDHDSSRHKTLLHEFETAKQNKNNDCEHYRFWWLWGFGNVP